MQIAIWLAIAVLVIVWVVWPSVGRRPPVLLLVRNRANEVEGVVRVLHSAGHVVMALDCGSSDDTRKILDRLAFGDSGVCVLQGGVELALRETDSPALLVLRLDERYSAKQALATLRIGR